MSTHISKLSFISRLRDSGKYIIAGIRTFPHNTRLFTARVFSGFTGKMLLWLILLFVVVANVYMAYGEKIGALPFFKHLSTQNAPDSARINNVLGSTVTKQSSPIEEENTKRDYEYWKTIIQDHPDYRDGYIQAAIRAYQLGMISEAKKYLEKARSIDPNFTGIPAIEDQQSTE